MSIYFYDPYGKEGTVEAEKAGRDVSWGAERRLEFIEFRLFWEGAINRSDIMDEFGVSMPQASKDLNEYQRRAPNNMTYDKSAKRYIAAGDFKPVFLKPDPDHYLSQLRAIADRSVEQKETWISILPNPDFLPIPHRRVNPRVLRTALAAVRNGRAMEILYQSMNPKRTEPEWRTISPHAFGSDGFRWHVRAFCHIDRKFKDFLLSRCLAAKLGGEALANSSADKNWLEKVEVELKPNPQLSSSQQKVIADDFEMENNLLRLSIRKSLLYYFQKRLRLDIAEVLDNPQEVPVVVSNRAAFDKALSESAS